MSRFEPLSGNFKDKTPCKSIDCKGFCVVNNFYYSLPTCRTSPTFGPVLNRCTSLNTFSHGNHLQFFGHPAGASRNSDPGLLYVCHWFLDRHFEEQEAP